MVLHPFRRQKGIPPASGHIITYLYIRTAILGALPPGRVGEHTPAK